jgi:hypothetical protein
MPSEYRIHNEVEYHLSSYSVHLWNEIPSIIVNNCCVEQLGLLWPCTGPSARISRDFSPGGYLIATSVHSYRYSRASYGHLSQ